MRRIQNRFLKRHILVAPTFALMSEIEALKETGQVSIDKSKFVEIRPFNFVFDDKHQGAEISKFGSPLTASITFNARKHEFYQALKNKFNISYVFQYKYAILLEYTDNTRVLITGLNVDVSPYKESTNLEVNEYLTNIAFNSVNSLIFAV